MLEPVAVHIGQGLRLLTNTKYEEPQMRPSQMGPEFLQVEVLPAE